MLRPTQGSRMLSASEEDRKYVRLLSISHYVYGVIAAMFSLGVSVAIGFGLWMFSHPEKFSKTSSGPPEWFLWIWGLMAASGIVFTLAHTVGRKVPGNLPAPDLLYCGRRSELYASAPWLIARGFHDHRLMPALGPEPL